MLRRCLLRLALLSAQECDVSSEVIELLTLLCCKPLASHDRALFFRRPGYVARYNVGSPWFFAIRCGVMHSSSSCVCKLFVAPYRDFQIVIFSFLTESTVTSSPSPHGESDSCAPSSQSCGTRTCRIERSIGAAGTGAAPRQHPSYYGRTQSVRP